MRWQRGRRSQNIEDRRGAGVARKAAGGGIGVIVISLIAMYFGVDPSIILNMAGPSKTVSSPASAPASLSPADRQKADFVSAVLADTEDTWGQLFKQSGKTYKEPKLVLFSGAVNSACGFAKAAMGPFYCPGDHKVYLDTSFFRELSEQMGAPGDFAQAYVIAHEIGHHIQSLTGISSKVQALRSKAGKVEGNKLSVKLELQADCLAGVWAHHADSQRAILEPGDIDEALNAASRIGDDRLQKQARGYVTPDSFTHGTSAQRQRWFKRGFESGDLGACNTFDTARL